MWQRFKSKRTFPETLSGALWRERLEKLCDACMEGIAAEAPARLREGYALMALAPERDSLLAQSLPPQATFEAMLACGALESAALALLPRGGSYLLSRGEDGFCLASVVLPGTTEEVTAEGASPALALLAAQSAALVMPAGATSGPLSDIARLMLPAAHLLN